MYRVCFLLDDREECEEFINECQNVLVRGCWFAEQLNSRFALSAAFSKKQDADRLWKWFEARKGTDTEEIDRKWKEKRLKSEVNAKNANKN